MALDKIVKTYEKWLDNYKSEGWLHNSREYAKAQTMLMKHQYDNKDIEDFVNQMYSHSTHDYYFRSGWFVSALIQRAYYVGHNDFLIDISTVGTEVVQIGGFLHGYLKDKIRVNIIGSNSGYNCIGLDASKVSFKIKGDVGYSCGGGASDCDIKIKGSAGESLGTPSHDSTFLISGDVGIKCGVYATDSVFTIGGKKGRDWGLKSKNCVFN